MTTYQPQLASLQPLYQFHLASLLPLYPAFHLSQSPTQFKVHLYLYHVITTAPSTPLPSAPHRTVPLNCLSIVYIHHPLDIPIFKPRSYH